MFDHEPLVTLRLTEGEVKEILNYAFSPELAHKLGQALKEIRETKRRMALEVSIVWSPVTRS